MLMFQYIFERGTCITSTPCIYTLHIQPLVIFQENYIRDESREEIDTRREQTAEVPLTTFNKSVIEIISTLSSEVQHC